MYDAKGISAIPPDDYKNRFLEFLKYKVFKIGNQEEIPKRVPENNKSQSKPKFQT